MGNVPRSAVAEWASPCLMLGYKESVRSVVVYFALFAILLFLSGGPTRAVYEMDLGNGVVFCFFFSFWTET